MNQTGEDRIERLMEMEPAAVMAGFRSGTISRRDLSKLFAALGLTAALGPAIGRNPALAQSNELTMIIWEGYTSDSFTDPWEEANDANVEATFAGTGDEMFAAMQGSGGTTYDMVSASSDLPQRLYDAGLLMEIDASKLTNYPDLYEQFQRPPYITFDDKLYGVNFAWGPTIMLYNPDEVAEAPTSWNALLDEQYSGKITTWNYPLQIAQYALLLDPEAGRSLPARRRATRPGQGHPGPAAAAGPEVLGSGRRDRRALPQRRSRHRRRLVLDHPADPGFRGHGRGGDAGRGRHRLVRFLVHLEQGGQPGAGAEVGRLHDRSRGPDGRHREPELQHHQQARWSRRCRRSCASSCAWSTSRPSTPRSTCGSSFRTTTSGCRSGRRRPPPRASARVTSDARGRRSPFPGQRQVGRCLECRCAVDVREQTGFGDGDRGGRPGNAGERCSRLKLGPVALLAAPMAWMAFFYLVPLGLLLLHAFWSVDYLTIDRTLTLDNLRTVSGNPLYPTVLLRTFLIAAAVTLTDIVLAFPIAFYIAKRATQAPRAAADAGGLSALELVSGARLRLEDDPRHQRHSQFVPADDGDRRRTSLGVPLFEDRDVHHLLPGLAAVHDPAALHHPRPHAELAAGGGVRPRRELVADLSPRHPAALAARVCSPAA